MTDDRADLEERLRLLRAASRPHEPREVETGIMYTSPRDGRRRSRRATTAQSHILDAIAKLEERLRRLG